MQYCFFKKNFLRISTSLFLVSMLLLFVGVVGLCVPTRADADMYENVIRLHVIANSDSEDDQALKYALRDAVIAEYSAILKGYSSKDEAYQGLSLITNQINEFCEGFIRNKGYDLSCNTIIGEEYYSRTRYQNFTMPEGKYTSLRIIIGDGNGKNWWCVLFPPMCTKAALCTTVDEDMEQDFIEAGFTGEQYRIITETEKPKYRVKFRLLELLFGN